MPASAITKNGKLGFVREFFRQLMRQGLVHENPAARIPRLKVGPCRKPYIYSLREIRCILEKAGKLKARFPGRLLGGSLQTMILLIYACGLRLGEALNLRIKDVDFDEKALALWNTKFHKERLVPFSPEVGEKLSAYLALRNGRRPQDGAEAPFFWWDGRRQPKSLIHERFRDLLVRCGLSKPTGPGPRLHRATTPATVSSSINGAGPSPASGYGPWPRDTSEAPPRLAPASQADESRR